MTIHLVAVCGDVFRRSVDVDLYALYGPYVSDLTLTIYLSKMLFGFRTELSKSQSQLRFLVRKLRRRKVI